MFQVSGREQHNEPTYTLPAPNPNPRCVKTKQDAKILDSMIPYSYNH